MPDAVVGILVGSESDRARMQAAMDELDARGIAWEFEVRSAHRVVTVQLRRQLKRHQVIERHAGVGRLQILQAAHEQPGAEQQQEAERDLRRYEAFAQEQRAARAGNRADRVFQGRPRIGTARANRRDDARVAIFADISTS